MVDVIKTSFHPDTQIYYKDDEGGRRNITFTELNAIFKAVDKPIIVYSLASSNIEQEANGLGANSTVLSNIEYQIALSNGATITCVGETRFIVTMTSSLKYGISPITGFTYVPAEFISVGDRIVAKNKDGYLSVVSVTPVTGSYRDYIGLSVPVYGNFFIRTIGTDLTETEVLASN